MKKLLLFFVNCVLICSCTTTIYSPVLSSTVNGAKKANEQFVDNFVSINVNSVQANGISITLKNLTNETIIIDWNEVIIVDSKGYAHNVVHSGVLKMDAMKYQMPSKLPAKTMVSETIYAVDTISSDKEAANIIPGDEIGQGYTVTVPIQIGSQQKTYTIEAKVTSLDSKEVADNPTVFWGTIGTLMIVALISIVAG